MMRTLKVMLDKFASLRLTVFVLAAALVLVFAGTLAQVKFGLYFIQEEYFQSWFVWGSVPFLPFRFPVYPGGHLLGAVLLINLIAAYIRRFSWNWKKLGIQFTHLGLIIMLAGGLATDLLSVSSYMFLREGESVDFSEDDMHDELAIIERTEDGRELVTAIAADSLENGGVISHPSLPFQVEVKRKFGNSSLHMLAHGDQSGLSPASSQGSGSHFAVKPLPPATRLNERNVTSAVIEIIPSQGESLGTWLVSRSLTLPQEFEHDGRKWSLHLRAARYYKPYTLTLLDFKHETYPGTNIPKNFASTVMLDDPAAGEHRKVEIYMNHPLRHGGETYYQSGFDKNDPDASILNVVRNPGYQAPYVACVVMSLGLMYQFSISLFGFVRRSNPISK